MKSDGYKRTRKTRVFLCAASQDESGQEALDWALECLVQDDDEFIVVRGFDAGELGKRLNLTKNISSRQMIHLSYLYTYFPFLAKTRVI